MDWYDCEVCGMRHPFRISGERDCPNREIVERTGLRGLEALKASGLFKRWEDLPAPPRPAEVGVSEEEASAGGFDRKAYQKEYMRRRREKNKPPAG